MTRCQHCYCPSELGHNEGCPTLDPANQAEFDKGYSAGFNYDEEGGKMSSSALARKPKPFQLGYRAGADAIDGLVDDAAQSRCFG